MRIFTIEEDEAEDLLKEIERQLKRRQWGQAIRLEVEEGIDERLLQIIEPGAFGFRGGNFTGSAGLWI